MKTRIAGTETDRRLVFWCPGCDEAHAPRVGGAGAWTWNNDRDRPTLAPSILVTGFVPLTDAEADRVMAGQPVPRRPRVCHSFVRDGRIEFLGDCTHSLAGQVIELPEWPLGALGD